MTQLDPNTRQALCALDQPPPGVEDRVFASILRTTGGGGDGGGGGGASGGESTLVYAAKVVGATLGLTAAGFALVAASAVGVKSLRTPADPRPTVIASSAEIPTATSEPLPAATTPALPEAAPEPAHDTTLPPAPSTAPHDEPSDPPSPAPTLEAELALLEQARRSAPNDALRALEQHRQQFEHGMLADEREALRVETLCALGRSAEATTAAETFLAANPQSPLRSRLEPACKKSPQKD